MAELYVVGEYSIVDYQVLGYFSSRELAESEMRKWVEELNRIEESMSSEWVDEDGEDLEPTLYTEVIGKDGHLEFVWKDRQRIAVSTTSLDAPCEYSWRRKK